MIFVLPILRFVIVPILFLATWWIPYWSTLLDRFGRWLSKHTL